MIDRRELLQYTICDEPFVLFPFLTRIACIVYILSCNYTVM